MVKQANGKGRMCIDFTNLNKACPKDSFPLPLIDQLVDTSVGTKRPREDSLCHRGGALLLSGHAFWPQECRSNLSKAKRVHKEACVKPIRDVRGPKSLQHETKSREVCFWGASSQVLRLYAFEKRNRGKLEKIQAIMEISSSRTIKDIQHLMGKNLFLMDRRVSSILRRTKLYLTYPPLLKSPQVGETLYLCLATSEETATVVLVRSEGIHQFLIYYVSEVFKNGKLSSQATTLLSSPSSCCGPISL
ncbi:GagPol3 [Gossypium australe]|uniref:GagPol3 n=1 Tax=Gossypium australe TaxID=47621 RepID=A0A5B6VUS9_9ROSI|nr:GagPol3 [Gossypium australe]